ncbi:BamA/TamA family outer membrane protein [Mucilaginibacter sp.]|uniref:translocation and assembly module lipoprotein TamL n=1 Tax=Mucilaginibacter sp. TaxID=1882438 RepID=UPI00260ED178|nr:BamA/TamA family outer membrane protein [Mucilaginibacter sp.]
MKAYIKPNGYRLAILSILLLFIGSGCSLTRRLKGNESLVRKITIKGIDDELAEAAVLYVDKEQQPNNVINLQFYYLFSKNGKRDIGEAPAILDSNLVEFSRVQIERFLQNKGYLKAKVTDTIKIKKKKAELIFSAVEGPLFRIRKLQDSIADKKVQDLYRVNRPRFSHVQPGGRFDTDSLAYDRDEFYLIMKRNGYYDFYRQYINFQYDSTFKSSVVDIKMIIDNPAGKSSHPIYTINNTLVTVSKSNGRTPGKADTVQVDPQFRYVDYSGKFKPHSVTDYIFQKKGQIYNIDQQTLTTSRLSELNVFRNVPNPTYTKLPDSTNRLDTKIDITPLKQFSDRVEGEFLFAGGRFGYNLGNTFTDRNVFKNAAILQIKTNWSILFDNSNNSITQAAIQNQDLRLGASLIYPRIIAPFNFPLPGKYGVPHTTFSTNYQWFYQKGLVSRESFINSISYDFFETGRKLHTITPIDIEFSKGTIDPAAQALLLKNNLFAYSQLIGRTIFSAGSQYTFQYNAIELNSYKNFTYFRGSLDVGGNTLSLLSNVLNTKRDADNRRTILGYPFAQYAKTEIDLRVYKSLGGERQFIFRLNPGIGIPYGNSDDGHWIFEKEFYAGGANDMRAWLPRTLGPGQFNRATAYNSDSLRTRLKYLDQFGEIKIIANAEYRYKLMDDFFGSKLKGAVFIDAGNVWRLHKQPDQPNSEFRLDNILQSTAIGIGTGLRFDLAFFVFRLDAAFKFKDPQFTGSDSWVLINHFNELFKSGTFKANYKATNSGDTYNFMQLNFGIGMPF